MQISQIGQQEIFAQIYRLNELNEQHKLTAGQNVKADENGIQNMPLENTDGCGSLIDIKA